MITAQVQILDGFTEQERQQKLIHFLRQNRVNTYDVVYLTLNRRKLREITPIFRELQPDGLWLPQMRTIRGFFDYMVTRYKPQFKIIGTEERHFLIREFISSGLQNKNTGRKLEALASDLEKTIQLCGQYGIPTEKAADYFSKYDPDIECVVTAYNKFLRNEQAMDYARAPFQFFEDVSIPPSDWNTKTLILDGLYWLYPSEKQILEQVISLFGSTVFMEDSLLLEKHRANFRDFNFPAQLEAPMRKTNLNGETTVHNIVLKALRDDSSPVAFFSHPTPMAEVRHITDHILTLLSAGETLPEEIAVVYLSPAYLPYIEHLFSYHRIPYDSGRGRPLTSLPLYSHLVSFLSLPLNGFSADSLLAILKIFQTVPSRLPVPSFLKWTASEIRVFEEWCRWALIERVTDMDFSFDPVSWINRLDKQDADFLPDSWSIFGEEPERLRYTAEKLKNSLDKLKALIHFFPRNALSAKDWATFMIKIHRIFSMLPAFTESGHRSESAWKQFLQKFHHVGAVIPASPRPYSKWMEISTTLLRHTEFRDERDTGIRLLEKLEVRGLQGKHLYIVGASRDNLPGRFSYPQLFQQILNAQLNKISLFPSHLEADYLLHHLVMNYKHINISWPRNNQGNNQGPVPQLMIWFAMLWQHSYPEETFDAGDLIRKFVQFPPVRNNDAPLFLNPDPADNTDNDTTRFAVLNSRRQNATASASCYNGFIGVNATWRVFLNTFMGAARDRFWSPSALDTLSACPQKFYYRYGLQVVPGTDTDFNGEKRLHGRLMHQILQNLYSHRALVDARRRRELIAPDHPAIHQTIADAFESIRKTMQPVNPLVPAMLEGLRHRLERQKFTELWLDLENHLFTEYPEAVRKIITEQEWRAEIKLGNRFPLKIRGRIDRTDVLDSQTVFYDYKTGSSTANYPKRMQHGLYWQLILYSLLLAEHFPGKSMRPAGFLYSLNIRTGKMTGLIYRKHFATFFEDFEKLIPHYRQKLEIIFSVPEAGHFYTSVLDEETVYCASCKYRRMCHRSPGFKPEFFSHHSLSDTVPFHNKTEPLVSVPVYIPRPIILQDEI